MRKLLFSCFILFIFLCAKCEDDTPKNPIDLLPPATQTGANTFGCLVDGEAFTPDGRPNSFDHSYIYSDGGYYLYISGSRTNPDGVISPAIGTEKLSVLEGETYFLINRQEGSAYGAWYRSSNSLYTSTEYSGELYISKHDFTNRIISGTFWYDIKDDIGEIHEIREGRFDIKY